MTSLPQFIQEKRGELAAAFKRPHKWHDYQDHCHYCGEEDNKRYPYCLPYEASQEIELVLTQLVEKMEECVPENEKVTHWTESGYVNGHNSCVAEIHRRFDLFKTGEEHTGV